MKAVILTDGRGERSRRATELIPKPSAPVLARPVMDYCLSLLAHHGVTRAYLAAGGVAEQLRDRYGNEAFGLFLSYLNDLNDLSDPDQKSLLGTCGGIKLLEKELSSEELFLVVKGDALCDFDPTEAIRFHRERGAFATLILSGVKLPSVLVATLRNAAERAPSLSTASRWTEALASLADTGVYILSPKVLEWVPSGKSFDLATDLFPLLIQRGLPVFGYKGRGIWCDLGIFASSASAAHPLHGRTEPTVPRKICGLKTTDKR